MVFGLFGVSWVMPQSVVGLLAWASSLLARLVCSSSIWEYMENHSPLLNVVSLEGKK